MFAHRCRVFALAIVAGAAAPNVLAVDTAIPLYGTCPHCTLATMREMALALAAGRSGTQQVYVSNIPQGIGREYVVSCRPARGDVAIDAPCERHVDSEREPAPTIQHRLQQMQKTWHATDGTMRVAATVAATDIPYPSSPPTVEEFATSFSTRGNFGYAVHQHALANAARWLPFLDSPDAAKNGDADGIIVTITVQLPDGARVDYAWRIGGERAEFVAGSARTSSGEAVPDNAARASPPR